MAQDFDSIPPTTLLSDVRQKILNRDEAHSTWFEGAAEPATMYAGMPWVDSSGGTPSWKVRNAANTAWYTLGSLVTDLGALLLTGGTMASDILLAGNPTNVLHPSSKQYTDGKMRVNKGKAWISHGNNVITFTNEHTDTNFLILPGLVNTPMGGVETRGSKHTKPMEVYSINESTTKAVIRIDGGYGFSSCGGVVVGTTQRFDDDANTHTARTAADDRQYPAAYSLNGFGFVSCGEDGGNLGTTERLDDVTNAWTGRANATARRILSGYSLNGKGFTSCGFIAANTGITERFDDVANTHTARLAATARQGLAGYSMNNKGFTSCGYIAAITGITQRFDDDANTHTARLAATARVTPAGYSMNGFGFTSCGNDGAVSGITERFDDDANTHTARAAATARSDTAGYSLNGFGFTTCGIIVGVTGITQRLDDDANTQTARLAAIARYRLTAFATNEYFINYITFNI